MDHEVRLLVGPDGMRQLDGGASLSSGPTPAPAPTTIMNVIVQAPAAAPAPEYADASDAYAAADPSAAAGSCYFPAFGLANSARNPSVARNRTEHTRLPGVHPREGFLHRR